MVSRVYIYLLAIAALCVSVTGAYFSVSGLVSLFAGTAASVGLMASALEFSKLVVVGFLYRYWGHIMRPLRMYMIFAVVVLMGITSLGIYGYLSNSYQLASLTMHSRQLEIDAKERENARLLDQIKEAQSFIDSIPAAHVSRRLTLQEEYQPKILALREKSEAVLHEIDELHQQMLSTHLELGPVAYLAEIFGVQPDTVVKWLILVFVLVFDPLAVSLVFGLNLLIRLREKYRGDEFKIGAHSLTSPVDHRTTKRAA